MMNENEHTLRSSDIFFKKKMKTFKLDRGASGTAKKLVRQRSNE